MDGDTYPAQRSACHRPAWGLTPQPLCLPSFRRSRALPGLQAALFPKASCALTQFPPTGPEGRCRQLVLTSLRGLGRGRSQAPLGSLTECPRVYFEALPDGPAEAGSWTLAFAPSRPGDSLAGPVGWG